jgi:molecular chaperone DnaJ
LITDHAYAELGLPLDASEQDIKSAWRRLVSQWHPDRNDSAQAVAKIQRINQAFESIRRARALGEVGTATTSAAPERPQRTAEPAAEAQAQAQAEAAPPAPEAPADDGPRRPPIRRKLKLTLEEAAAGCIKTLRGKLTATCSSCEGAGHQMLGGHCASCGGSGAIQQRSAWFGWPSVSIECEACLGGGFARRDCPACAASGKLETAYKVQVRIPHGVRDGDLLHVDARRSAKAGAPADLEIQVQIEPHPFFRLDEADGLLRCEIPVNGFAWVANRTVQVPTLYGWHLMQLDRDRLAYILPGLGYPGDRRGARGDQLVTLVPVFPTQLSTDQEILLDQLIATTSKGTGTGSSERLRAWDKDLRAWEKTLVARKGAAQD